MTNRQNPSIDEVFFAAMEREIPEARAAYLDEVCATDAELRRRVERLLDAQPKVGSFLDAPAASETLTIAPPQAMEGPGTIIGPYKLLEQIGEGGMGIVYMAEQTEPVRRKVALKIIKPGMDTKQVVARFEAERQALALMDHPNIAKVLDAGTTESGRPYFVMELVRGVPISEYCDQHRLTIPERLNLFKQVCQAVQHAHQKGIIHRDIKPTNVLVTSLDGAPLPRVIDFGIAKATGQSLTDKTLFTGFAQLVGTPLYMSPEQAELSAVDVDTRSDIYSLGVLLYELLTGTTPFDTDTFRTAALDEVRRIIREDEPPKPSTRLSALGATLTTVFDNRQTDARKLDRSLRGDLDWIVMKALEKDRARRYETASGLARDVERYLAGEPVEAGPPSGWYRLSKFARRNKAVLTTVCVVAVALIVGTVFSTWQAVRATQAEARARREEGKSRAAAAAERTAKLAEAEQRQLTASNLRRALHALHQTYLQVAERLPEKAELSPDDRILLEKILAFYEDFAQQNTSDPMMQDARVVVYYRIGQVYQQLGQLPQAEAALRQGVTLSRELVSQPLSPGTDTLRNRMNLNTCIDRLGLLLLQSDSSRLPEAQELLGEAVWDLERLLADSREFNPELAADLARSLVHLGLVLKERGRAEQAASTYRHAEQLFRQVVADPAANPDVKTNLSVVLYDQADLLMDQKPEEALRCLEEAVTYQQAALVASPRNVDYRAKLGHCFGKLGNTQERLKAPAAAEKAYVHAAAALEAVVAEVPGAVGHRSELARVLSWLGTIRANHGRPEDAEPAFRRCVALNQKLVDQFPDQASYLSELAQCYFNLGNVLAWTNRKPEAEKSWRAGAELSRKCMGKFSGRGTDTLISCLQNLGVLMAQLNRDKEAESLYNEAVTAGRELVARIPSEPHNNYLLGMSLESLAEVQYDLGEVAGAIRLLDEAIGQQELAFKSLSWNPGCGKALVNHYETLAEWLANARDLKLRNPRRAGELARKALKLAPDSRDGHVTLGIALYRAGDARAAIAEIERGLALDKVEGAPTVTCWFFLVMAHAQLRDQQEARRWYNRAVAWADKNPEYKEKLSRWRVEAAELLDKPELREPTKTFDQ